MAAAPRCIASGFASSDSCVSVREVGNDSSLELAVLKRSDCDTNSRRINPHLSYLIEQIKALPKEFDKTAGTKEHICIRQIPDVVRKYNLIKVEWIPGDNLDFEDMFLCYYSAVSSSDSDSIPIMVMSGRGDVNIGYAAKDPRNTFSIQFERLINYFH